MSNRTKLFGQLRVLARTIDINDPEFKNEALERFDCEEADVGDFITQQNDVQPTAVPSRKPGDYSTFEMPPPQQQDASPPRQRPSPPATKPVTRGQTRMHTSKSGSNTRVDWGLLEGATESTLKGRLNAEVELKARPFGPGDSWVWSGIRNVISIVGFRCACEAAAEELANNVAESMTSRKLDWNAFKEAVTLMKPKSSVGPLAHAVAFSGLTANKKVANGILADRIKLWVSTKTVDAVANSLFENGYYPGVDGKPIEFSTKNDKVHCVGQIMVLLGASLTQRFA